MIDAAAKRARNVRVQVVEAATGNALATAVNAFLNAAGERTLLSVQYQNPASGVFSAMIVYTE